MGGERFGFTSVFGIYRSPYRIYALKDFLWETKRSKSSLQVLFAGCGDGAGRDCLRNRARTTAVPSALASMDTGGLVFGCCGSVIGYRVIGPG